MASVFDVAKYILQMQGPLTTMKLQKLVYYSQAWALVWDDEAIFPERIEAWISGPVVPDLFAVHRGRYKLTEKDIKGNTEDIKDYHKETIDCVLEYYGPHSAQWLVDLSHHEEPWVRAREDLPPDVRGNREIPPAEIAEFYSSL